MFSFEGSRWLPSSSPCGAILCGAILCGGAFADTRLAAKAVVRLVAVLMRRARARRGMVRARGYEPRRWRLERMSNPPDQDLKAGRLRRRSVTPRCSGVAPGRTRPRTARGRARPSAGRGTVLRYGDDPRRRDREGIARFWDAF